MLPEGADGVERAKRIRLYVRNLRFACEEAAASKKAAAGADKLCADVAGAVESFFQQHGKRVANKLKKGPAALLKTSAMEPYLAAGRRQLAKLASHCAKGGEAVCGSQSRVTALFEGKIKGVDFTKWITNVGIENTNPMYEALKDKALNADL